MSIFDDNQKLIIVSNRLPVSVEKTDDGLVFTQSSGGLATAMSSLDLDKEKFLWVGWPGIASDDLTATDKRKINTELKKYGCVPVYLTSHQVENFYSGYANDTIWPLFHYFQSYVKHKPEFWEAYKEVNQAYNKSVSKYLNDNTYVWIHDYHLMLLPKMLRTLNANIAIGFFLHIPFPSYEIFRLLPNRREVFSGLLACDLVGLHMYDYVRHFLSTATRLFPTEVSGFTVNNNGHKTTAETFPIGIDFQKFESATQTKEVGKALSDLKKYYQNKKIILSVDRLDYSKGIPKRLQAFEKYLENHPEMHGKVSMAMIAVPSRTDVETYQNLRDEVDMTVSRINGRFSKVGWHPIDYHFRNMPFDELVAHYMISDVALVTPIRDGMNLVSKEYVACRVNNDGVLILSEMVGAIDELHEAIKINPNNIESIARSIHNALNMPKKDQVSRMKSMKQRISNYTVQAWAKDFLDQLTIIKTTQEAEAKKIINETDKNQIINSYKKSKKRLILLDYDGTLREFVDNQETTEPKPSTKLLKIIKELTSDPKNSVFIISGRTHETLDKWFDKTNVNLIAEHGALRKIDNKWHKQPHNFDEVRGGILEIVNKYTIRTPASVTENKQSAVVWHYRAVPAQLAYVRRESLISELENILGDENYKVHIGNKIVEIRPDHIGKNFVSEKLVSSIKPDFILAIGDDYTDEDMFIALPDESFKVKVGLDETSANYRVATVNDVHKLLKSLFD